MVTYFKGSGILTGTLSAYTVTVMWFATLTARMLFAFVFPIKRAERAMVFMSVGCLVFYFGLVQADSQWLAIVLLFAFSASMAGLNPTAVSCAGKMTSVASMGIMLPVASSGAILMPWITGVVAEAAGDSGRDVLQHRDLPGAFGAEHRGLADGGEREGLTDSADFLFAILQYFERK